MDTLLAAFFDIVADGIAKRFAPDPVSGEIGTIAVGLRGPIEERALDLDGASVMTLGNIFGFNFSASDMGFL